MEVAAALLMSVVAGLVAPAGASQGPAGEATRGRPPTILFLCPHGAAKSVLASAYFQALAKARGLNVRVESAGTEPDAAVSPAVEAHLKAQGYAVPVAKPRRVAPEELGAADVVVSIGCDLGALPPPRGKVIRWDDVPGMSEGITAADETIRKRVADLVEELVRALPRRK